MKTLMYFIKYRYYQMTFDYCWFKLTLFLRRKGKGVTCETTTIVLNVDKYITYKLVETKNWKHDLNLLNDNGIKHKQTYK